jgi:hypothetical protein
MHNISSLRGSTPDTKIIKVRRSDVTLLEVSKEFSITDGDDDVIRSLLINTIPVEGQDQVDEPLRITDCDTGAIIRFNVEDL